MIHIVDRIINFKVKPKSQYMHTSLHGAKIHQLGQNVDYVDQEGSFIHFPPPMAFLILVSCHHIYVPAECGMLRPVCRLTCSGISLLISSGEAPANCNQNANRIDQVEKF